MVTTTILAKVEAGRLQKAVEGLVSGAYTIPSPHRRRRRFAALWRTATARNTGWS